MLKYNLQRPQTIGTVEGLMNICLPFMTLEDIMDKLNTKYWFSTMQNTEPQLHFPMVP